MLKECFRPSTQEHCIFISDLTNIVYSMEKGKKFVMNSIYSRKSWINCLPNLLKLVKHTMHLRAKKRHKTYFWHMEIYYYPAFIIKTYDLGLSFLPLYKAKRETLATLTTLKRTPGMSPTAWPLRPNPATRTSSFSSIKFKQPSLGTKAVIFLPFLISWTLTHFLMAEFGCLASTPTFSSTIPLAWEAPPKGLAFRAVPKWAFLYCLSCHFWSHRWLRSFLAVRRPRHLPRPRTPHPSCRRHGPERKSEFLLLNRNWSPELRKVECMEWSSQRNGRLSRARGFGPLWPRCVMPLNSPLVLVHTENPGRCFYESFWGTEVGKGTQ